MNTILLTTLFTGFVTLPLFSQVHSTTDILQEIEQNNLELKAFQAHNMAQSSGLQAENALPGLDLSGYFLPYGNTTSGKYWEYEISQTLEFPTVYGKRKKLISLEKKKLETEFLQQKLAIFSAAKEDILHIISLKKRKELLSNRLVLARQLFDESKKQHELGNMGALEISNAKISFLAMQLEQKEVNQQLKERMQRLSQWNGGKQLELSTTEYEAQLTAFDKESLWQEYQENNPSSSYQNQLNSIATQQLSLAQALQLPELTFGYNYQGFAADNSSGFKAGIVLPLWGAKHRKNEAKSNFDYNTKLVEQDKNSIQIEFDKTFDAYHELLSIYNEYKENFDHLESEEVLIETEKLKQNNSFEYIQQLEQYFEAKQSLLELELELQVLRNELTSFRLVQ